ncbi:MAG: exodeoxyribonuclease VII small subunit [Ignavibacteria bacterium]|nr:exodeoxyribonuclease VII small subunit [Ignavibacteria bacterium]
MSKSKSTFEKDLQRLEFISQSLESENITLEESIKLYEEGVVLSKKLLKILDEAELKINQLKAELDGSISKTKFVLKEDE